MAGRMVNTPPPHMNQGILPQITHAELGAEAKRRFGENMLDWKFVCPVCGHIAAVKDWQAAGAPNAAAAYSCVGRWSKQRRESFPIKGSTKMVDRPCDYAGGGFFALNPQPVLMPDGVVFWSFALAPEGS